MQNIEGIVIIDGEASIPLFSKLDSSIDDALFSAFLSAIKTFSSELNLGGLSSFSTDEKSVFLLGRTKFIIAIISPMDTKTEQLISLGLKIGSAFEDRFENLLSEDNFETTNFEEFAPILEHLISDENVPFLAQASEFVRKEYSGDLAIETSVVDINGDPQKIDIIAQRGEKKSKSFRDVVTKRLVKGFSEDVSFVKVIEGTGGKQEVIDFINSMDKFGNRTASTEDGKFPYFPARCIVIAQDYSPTLLDALKEYPTRSGKAFIGGSHIISTSRSKASPNATKCYIELWKWEKTSSYPSIYFS